MSFIKVNDIQSIIEGMVTSIWDKTLGKKLTKEMFPHMTYNEAMSTVSDCYHKKVNILTTMH
jgi:aspartyl-tRNA synthetase